MAAKRNGTSEGSAAAATDPLSNDEKGDVLELFDCALISKQEYIGPHGDAPEPNVTEAMRCGASYWLRTSRTW